MATELAMLAHHVATSLTLLFADGPERVVLTIASGHRPADVPRRREAVQIEQAGAEHILAFLLTAVRDGAAPVSHAHVRCTLEAGPGELTVVVSSRAPIPMGPLAPDPS